MKLHSRKAHVKPKSQRESVTTRSYNHRGKRKYPEWCRWYS